LLSIFVFFWKSAQYFKENFHNFLSGKVDHFLFSYSSLGKVYHIFRKSSPFVLGKVHHFFRKNSPSVSKSSPFAKTNTHY